MPRKKSDVNKGQLVHEVLDKNPKAKASEVVAALAEKGVKVSSTYVYGLKAMGKAEKRKAKPSRRIAKNWRSEFRNGLVISKDAAGLLNKSATLRPNPSLITRKELPSQIRTEKSDKWRSEKP